MARRTPAAPDHATPLGPLAPLAPAARALARVRADSRSFFRAPMVRVAAACAALLAAGVGLTACTGPGGITNGMSEGQVIQRLGAPDAVYETADQTHRWVAFTRPDRANWAYRDAAMLYWFEQDIQVDIGPDGVRKWGRIAPGQRGAVAELYLQASNSARAQQARAATPPAPTSTTSTTNTPPAAPLPPGTVIR